MKQKIKHYKYDFLDGESGPGADTPSNNHWQFFHHSNTEATFKDVGVQVFEPHIYGKTRILNNTTYMPLGAKVIFDYLSNNFLLSDNQYTAITAFMIENDISKELLKKYVDQASLYVSFFEVGLEILNDKDLGEKTLYMTFFTDSKPEDIVAQFGFYVGEFLSYRDAAVDKIGVNIEPK